MPYSISAQQAQNAETIVRVGLSLGANLHQLRAALAAAWVESRWQNLNHGDRDSVGLFQQRPSMGWGSIAEILVPENAARKFFLGAGTNPGAFKVSNAGTAGQLAQRVQRSAFPNRYDEQIGYADEILRRFSQNGGELAAALGRIGAQGGSGLQFPSATILTGGAGVGLAVAAVFGLILVRRLSG